MDERDDGEFELIGPTVSWLSFMEEHRQRVDAEHRLRGLLSRIRIHRSDDGQDVCINVVLSRFEIETSVDKEALVDSVLHRAKYQLLGFI